MLAIVGEEWLRSSMTSYTADATLSELIKEAAASGDPLEIMAEGERSSIVVASIANGSKRGSLDQTDIARSRACIRRAAGSWQGLIDAEEFKAYIGISG